MVFICLSRPAGIGPRKDKWILADKLAEKLRELADTLEEAKRELILAREQSTKPEWLQTRIDRAAVQAARVVAAAVDLGFSEIWLQGWFRSITAGSRCNPDGTLRDDTAISLWVYLLPRAA